MKAQSEVVRSKPANTGMRTKTVVEGFNAGKNSGLGFIASGKAAKVNLFTFEPAEEIFSNGIVIRISLS